MANLETTLRRLAEAQLRLNKEKCTFMAPEADWVDYRSKWCQNSAREGMSNTGCSSPTDSDAVAIVFGHVEFLSPVLSQHFNGVGSIAHAS